MELLKKLLENLGINEETFRNTFAIIIEAGERMQRIEEKQAAILKLLTNQSLFDKEDENGEIESVKFDDDIAIDGLQTSEGDNTASFFEGSDIQSSTENGTNPNIGKS